MLKVNVQAEIDKIMNDKERLYSMQKLMRVKNKETETGKYQHMKKMDEMKKQVQHLSVNHTQTKQQFISLKRESGYKNIKDIRMR